MKKKHSQPKTATGPSKSKFSVLRQICNLIPPFLVSKLARETGVDTRARSYTPWSHVVTLLYAQLVHAIGLNDVCDSLRLHSGLLVGLRGATPPSRNNLSHANRERDAALAEKLFWAVLEHLRGLHAGFAGGRRGRGLARRFRRVISVVDSTTIQLVASCMDWARHRRRKAAAKCHLRLDLHSFLPRFAIIDTARDNDAKRAREICAGIRPGEIVLFDKAYIDFAHLWALTLRGIFWVTRAKDNMVFDVIEQRPVQGAILRDDIVCLGRAGAFADYYHALLAIKRWPHRTSNSNPPAIGLIHHLTGLPMLDYAVTLNARPLPIRAEINKSEKQLKRNTGDYADSARHELLTSARKMERKIERLSQGYTFPFESLMTINVWAKSYEELDQKLNAIKNAVNSMNGAQTYEPALAATTKKLWYQTWPGWAGTYTNYSLYSENNYLADLIPFSSSFTGFLDTAEALYDGTNGNLVGVCTFREGTPQHGVLLGMSGAGKSVFMEDLLSQTEPYYGYTVIIEEGNSHGVYAKTFSYKDRRGDLQWCKTINIKPDSNLTVNLFDTQGAPLNPGHAAILVALTARMIGESRDEDVQQHREALLTHYIHQLYRDTYESWAQDNPSKALEALKLACAVDLYRRERMEEASGLLEAYADLRDLRHAHEDQYQEFIAKITEEQLTRFSKSTDGDRTTMEVAYSLFEPYDYPQLSALPSLMRHGRLASHDKDKVHQMADMLVPWTVQGNYRLFDGVSNVVLTEKMAHFELGNIPPDAVNLKAAAYLLINGFVRQNLITRPRHERKRLIFEEAARTLGAKGGPQIVEESYTGLRKFGVWVFAIVQQYALFERSPIRAPVMNNSKNFFIMRQMDVKDVANIAKDSQLPETSQRAVMDFPLPEYLPAHDKHSTVCYYVPSAHPPLCGNVKNYVSPEMVYVSSSNGEIYDKRMKQLAKHSNPIEGILHESKQT